GCGCSSCSPGSVRRRPKGSWRRASPAEGGSNVSRAPTGRAGRGRRGGAGRGRGGGSQSWSTFRSLLGALTRTPSPPVTDQIDQVLKFLTPLVRQNYDDPEQRIEDLKKLRGLGERYENRSAFLAELTLDPPSSTRDLAA